MTKTRTKTEKNTAHSLAGSRFMCPLFWRLQCSRVAATNFPFQSAHHRPGNISINSWKMRLQRNIINGPFVRILQTGGNGKLMSFDIVLDSCNNKPFFNHFNKCLNILNVA